MFGRRQQQDELKAVLAEVKREQDLQHKMQKEQADAQKEQTASLKELRRELAVCREQVDLSGKNIEKQLKRHSEAIEDLLDEQGSHETVIQRYEHLIKESEERENMLLALLCRYQEEFGLIEEKLCDMDQQHAEDWRDQISLFRKSLESEMRQCAIVETGRPGELVDYRYHEILDAEDTDEAERNGTVAHCYRPGCTYHGRVFTKAQVRVYRVLQ